MVNLKQAIVNLPPALAQVTMTADKINDNRWIIGSFGVVERGQAYLLKPVE